ncbi:MAG: NAD(P)/FAD-dependent oxidoreductase [Nevskia sp.]|jgi:phytoene dehydrogenase-like protein|nr:NAD(P)/FAD-dependent oxidoreductase [Nevskia sp.]MCK9383583.1 NAD(P)/FAD-dependent oxidoreductase [Nevskia sp.]
MNTNYDIIIVGGGHNGLVCAAYLARAGKKVLVLERNAEVGGAAVTEEIAPGYRVSVASYLISLLLPEVVNDLDLPRHGYKVLGRNPSSFTPLPDGRSLLMGPDAALTHAEIAKFSQRDATAYPQYEAWLTRVAECIEPLLLEPPADLIPLPAHWRRRTWVQKLRELLRGRRLYQALRGMGDELPQTIELLTGAARPILDRWFESDALKATLATDAIIGAQQPISAPGTGYVLLHHVMGLAGGARGVWGYVEGGMGAVTQAMARAAVGFGVEIRCNAEVAEILTANGRASGVRLMNGDVLQAKALASNATAAVTFSRLLPAGALPASFTAAVQCIDYSSASMKINLAVSELPDFTCLPGKAEVGPQHRGTIHISPTLQYIERAYDDANAGRPSQAPILELTIPTSVDKTLAPAGHHIVQMFVQYAPYRLATGLHWDALREGFADRCIAAVNDYAPNFAASILHRQILTPLDIERRFALTGGNIFQGAMSLHQLFSMRPLPGWADYRTPISGLYLCGAAAHPGGGVTGAPGRNCALEMLRDL